MGSIELYHICFKDVISCLPQLYPILSKSEQERACRFVYDRDREPYILCRGILRHLLAQKIQCPPCALSLGTGRYGKPMINPQCHNSTLQFNLSHQNEHALIAITEKINIGVDIECIRSLTDFNALIKICLSVEEYQIIEKLPHHEQLPIFFLYWTRKEALLKGVGTGITENLASYNCGDVNNPMAKIYINNCIKQKWTIEQLDLELKHYAAAIAYEGEKKELLHKSVSVRDF